MKNRDRIILLILISLFLVALIKLFSLRFEWGDVYPRYSSLRADPLGTKILFESLENLEGITISRNYHSFSRMSKDTSALFFIGIKMGDLDFLTKNEMVKLEAIAEKGGRIAFLFYPEKGGKCEAKEEISSSEEGSTDEEKQNSAEEKADEDILEKFISVGNQWKFKTLLSPAEKEDKHKIHKAFLLPAHKELPRIIDIHSDLYFETEGSEWKTVYVRDDLPVVIERPLGKGSVVLVADSYFSSNEALTSKKEAALLAWLVGPNKRIVFDETHLGVRNNPGVAALAKKYDMEGILAATFLVALLFIWKNSTSFIPPDKEEPGTDGGEGRQPARDHLAGFTGLLKKSVPPDNVLPVCMEEWEKSLGKGEYFPPGKADQVRDLFNDSQKHSQGKAYQLDLYRRISKLLSERI